MTIAQKIRMALAYRGMSEAELARRTGSYANAFNQRMKTGKFTQAELENMAKILGAEYHSYFEFPDGTKIIDLISEKAEETPENRPKPKKKRPKPQ